MRSSLLPVVALLVLAAAAAACLAHAGAEPATPRRSLTSGFPPTIPSSDDLDWCWESLVALGFCKDDFVASFLAGRPAPRQCCQAFDKAGHHCGPFTRAFLSSILPRGLLAQCAHQQAVTGAPTRLPGQRRAPPRAPTLETRPRASGGAPPAPEARTDARSPPPRTPPEASVSVGEDDQSPPEPKVIVAGGSAGRTPDAPVAAAAATPPPQKGVPAARPSVKGPPVE
ncbi:unnamed protein product [Urochloa decumbens]|uniref:Prolamin-like domain-containing protein n=1 Tax=Urochloa decumbens TaxID=240449 RepID=A0ABC9CT93_9POAL